MPVAHDQTITVIQSAGNKIDLNQDREGQSQTGLIIQLIR